MLMIAFLVVFSLFLIYCVDWTFLHQPATSASHPTLASVTNLSGFFHMSWLVTLGTIASIGLWLWQVTRIVQEIPSLLRMRRFYEYLLEVPDDLLPSIEFHEIIAKVVSLQQTHPISVDRLDTYDISNRIMRRENYLIALFNKDVFRMGMSGVPREKSSLILTKTLEWNITFCVLNYVFDEDCAIRKSFLKDVHREKLSQGLKRRFIIMGLVNLILAPLIFVFLLAYFIFRYGEEIYHNPKTISMRQYTTAARWRLREFNELPHYFNKRLANSHRKATKYMDQFHSNRLSSFARLLSFMAGSFAVVLILVTIINEDLLMHFELSAGKSVIWYVGFFGVILAITRSMMPDSSHAHDPAKLMTEIVEYTHYLPRGWRGRLHTESVRSEFGEMFDYKFSILLNELISIIVTPFVLLFSLPKCTDGLVEFFREFTVHIDGIGYVCSFALFDFKRHGNRKYGGGNTDKQKWTRQGKMEKSFLSFVANNPNWTPDDAGSQFLGRLHDFEMEHSQRVPDLRIQGASAFLRPPPTSRIRKMTSPRQFSTLVEDDPGVEEEEEEVEEEKVEGLGVRNGIISVLNQYYDFYQHQGQQQGQ